MAPYFWIDDVWVTGYLAGKEGIQHHDIKRHFTPSGEHLVTSKLMQNPVILHHDFVVGPLVSWPGLAAALQRRAAWCWEHRCNNTVYNTLSSTEDTGDKTVLAFADNTFKLDHF